MQNAWVFQDDSNGMFGSITPGAHGQVDLDTSLAPSMDSVQTGVVSIEINPKITGKMLNPAVCIKSGVKPFHESALDGDAWPGFKHRCWDSICKRPKRLMEAGVRF
jgi:hypothetical protein